ncbi:PREDICTED: arylacetamide deacetylase-like 4 [Thamnophis sirtalis]|uniref:Arylacetamide deacetylase-like 4 n=1 Tax=Thamnophis sirtalis TaxID=35019 RepID=A0A6I9YZG6_9SAUR|nr:PREDICTED: arylacetamide deacetylase-like 4 [Thamnophis sirtalis]
MGSGIMDAVVADLKVFGLDFAEGEDQDAIAEKCFDSLCLPGFSLNFCTEQDVLLGKLGLCHEFALWKFLVNGIFPVGSCDLVITETLFDAVPVRIYQCKTSNPEKRQGLVWLHGGVGISGSFPQQRGCYAAVSYFLKNATEFGVDPQRIVLGGDSSGGALVLAVSQDLVFRTDLPRVRAHVLLYPFLQALDFNLPSYQQNQSVPLLFRRNFIRFGLFYLAGKKLNIDCALSQAHIPEHLRAKYQKWISHEHIPEKFKRRGYVPFIPGPFSEDLFKECEKVFEARFSPLLTEDDVLQQFPETFLLTCEYDIFRDEGLLYKKRLDDNRVRVTWKHLEDGFHGISLLIGLGAMEFPGTRSSLKSVIQFLQRF